MKRKKISPERKATYYAGMTLLLVGGLLFLSVFVTAALNTGNFGNFEGRMRSSALRAVGGMVLILAGILMRTLGVRGLAGSGAILDPEKARKDVEPWARMAGGVIRDAVEETGLEIGKSSGGEDLPFDEKLRRLHKLHEEGLITEEEYRRERQEVLDSN